MRLRSLLISALGLFVVFPGCGSDKKSNPVTPDTTPPAAITDVVLTALTDSSGFIAWTAPGDDGNTGTAEAYDVRVAQVNITDDNWDQAIQVNGEPTPHVAGTHETMEVIVEDDGQGALSLLALADEKAYLAIRTVDDAGNWSELSNILEVVTGTDDQPPAMVTDLALVSQTDSSATVSWTAPGDDGNDGQAATYDVRVYSETITEANWDQAIPVDGEPNPQYAGTAETFTVPFPETAAPGNLADDEALYIALRTQDDVDNVSPISNNVMVLLSGEVAVSIPDAALLAQIRTDLGLPSGSITADDMLNLGPIFDVENKGISNITGLEFATNVAELRLSSNSITLLTPLAGLTQLQSLWVDHNLFNDLTPLQNLTDLNTLDISNNFVSNVSPLAGLTGLVVLEMSDNTIDSIGSLSGLTALQILGLQSTDVDDIGIVTGMTDLSMLNLSDTQVSNLGPLAANSGFGTGDEVNVAGCPLSQTSLDDDITTLEGRGATVTLGDDIWPPAVISDLAVDAVTDSSMTLSWTSPGGSARTGANAYDVRYSSIEITEGNWAFATPVDGEPTPATPGASESMTVVFPSAAPGIQSAPGANAQASYYVAVKSKDAADNTSALSNVVMADLLDTTPPGTITSLQFVSFTETSITVKWYTPGDDGYDYGDTAMSYDIRYSTDPITEENWESATPAANIPDPQGTWTEQTFEVTGLTPHTRYYIGIKTKDESNNESELSNVINAVPLANTVVTFNDAALESAVRSELSIPSGDITTLDMAGLDNLVANNVGISDLTGLEAAANLVFLSLQQNNIGDLSPLAGLTALEDLRLYENPLSNVTPLQNLVHLTALNLANTAVTDASPLSGMADLRTLYLYNSGLSDLDGMQGLSSLEILNVATNPLSDLTPISGLVNINTLNINSTNVSNLGPISALTAMEYLEISNCPISDISALAGMVDMQTLSMNYNSISDISVVSGMSQLSDLSAVSNSISDISAVSGLTLMEKLWLYDNNISDISALTGMVDLEQLSLFANNISDIGPLSGMTKMRRLFIADNPFSDTSVLTNLTDLEELTLSTTNITDLSDLAGLTNLWSLNVGDTGISDLSPLAGLSALRHLECWSAASLSDISTLQGLTNLEEVYLGYTAVSDLLPLVNNAAFATGDFLNVVSCPLSAMSTGSYIPTLEGRGVTVVQ